MKNAAMINERERLGFVRSVIQTDASFAARFAAAVDATNVAKKSYKC